MPLHDPTQPLLKERAEREARRVRLWCERKDAVWDAMQTENARARDAWTSTVRPRR
jgi:crotonobetainyl-CoA:carnitine CoA-transferase CaiB-like acyl-CoA transferase